MKEENDKKLCKDFPYLYRGRQHDGEGPRHAITWGFECGDGWFDLLYKCSAKIEHEIRKMKQEDPSLGEDDLPSASQIKEKYGTLRFYMNLTNEIIEEAINEAEDASCTTCEECGAFGSTRGGGWIKTLCDLCAKHDGRD